MSRIRSKNTKPELVVRKFLYANGVRYRLTSNLPGKPDLVIGGNIAVFVNGCFWHCHEGCKDFRIPKTRVDFWEQKLKRNTIRDKANYTALQKLNIRTVVIWECNLKPAQQHETLRNLLKEIRTI